jgi:ammonium transporter, Amt family
VQPWAAIIIGITAGVVYVAASHLMSHILKIDDPLDAVAVHAFCGMWGLLMAACFSHHLNYKSAYFDYTDPETLLSKSDVSGCFMGGNGKLLGAAVVFILAIAGWVLGHMVPFFLLMRMLGLLRVNEAEERRGLDVSHHGGFAYEQSAFTSGEVIKGGNEGITDQNLVSRCAIFI